MKSKAYIYAVLVLALSVGLIAPQARAESAQSREYQVKAAFIYNFTKFVDWPAEKMADSNEPIVIGIIGRDPFGRAFEAIEDKQVKGRGIVVKRFECLEETEKSGKDKAKLAQRIETLRKCHLLFICSSEKNNLAKITTALKDYPVLTVGETDGFVEAGGIVELLVEHKKVRFEVNLTAAKGAKLKIRSKLLRLAKRVVEEKEGDHSGVSMLSFGRFAAVSGYEKKDMSANDDGQNRAKTLEKVES